MTAAPPLPRHRFTRGDFERMIEAGVLGPDDRVELLDGEIIEMSPIGPIHADVVDRLTGLLVQALGDQAIVRVQNPLQLSHRSQPQPDLLLAYRKPEGYRAAHPGPTDTLLVVEVADASLPVDRDIKLPLYAAEGIREVWIVDLGHREIAVYRRPSTSRYDEVSTVRVGDAVSVDAFPDVRFGVADIIGPDEPR